MTASTMTLTVASDWKREEIELLKQTVAAGTTDLEFALFSKVCHRTGLDPFTRQIYAIKRKQQRNGAWVDVMTIQTGIDGYRVIAERTDEYLGGDEPAYGPPCECGNRALGKHPEYATVTVRRWKHGAEHATTERADFDEYVQTKSDGKATAMWAKMPKRMIAKCAEALALRRAFPGLFEGVYTAEEMAQADSEHVIDVPTTGPSQTAQRAASNGHTTPAASQSSTPISPGERPFLAGDPCPACAELGISSKFGIASGGRYKGRLQCRGKLHDGTWANHPAPPTDGEMVGAQYEAEAREAAFGDSDYGPPPSDDDDVPF